MNDVRPAHPTQSMSSHVLGASDEGQQRFRTLEVAATVSHDTVALGRIIARAADARRREMGPDSTRLYGPPAGETSAGGSGDGWARQEWHIQWAPPTLWRQDVTWPGGQSVAMVVRSDVSLSYISMHRTLYTSEPAAPGGRLADLGRRLFRESPEGAWPSEVVHLSTIAERLAEFPLTDPRLPESEWELTTLGEESYMQRTVRRVRATRLGSLAYASESERSGYWPWLDEYEYLVDDALQILLQLTGIADGVPVGIISVDNVRVDAPLPADVFTFVPPAGTRIAHVKRRT